MKPLIPTTALGLRLLMLTTSPLSPQPPTSPASCITDNYYGTYNAPRAFYETHSETYARNAKIPGETEKEMKEGKGTETYSIYVVSSDCANASHDSWARALERVVVVPNIGHLREEGTCDGLGGGVEYVWVSQVAIDASLRRGANFEADVPETTTYAKGGDSERQDAEEPTKTRTWTDEEVEKRVEKMLNTTFRPSAHAAGPAPGRRWTGDEEFVAFLNRLTSSQHTQDVDDANAFLPLNSDNVQTPIISSPSPFPYEFDDSSLPSLKGIKAQILFRKPGAALIALSRPRPTTSTNDDEHESKNAINIDIPLGAIVSSYLPRFYKLISLPSSPLPPHPLHLSSSSRTQEDGREDATATSAVRAVLKSLAVKGTSPKISCIIANLSLAQMIEDVQVLTGETPLPQSPGKDDATVTGNEERLRTRHSFSSDALKAAAWIRDVVEASGGGVDCEVRQFLEGFAPNVICRYPPIRTNRRSENGGGGNQTIILSAHYDSRGSYGSTRAPGGDDDGSGVVGVLGIARVLGGVVFRDRGVGIREQGGDDDEKEREGKGVGTHVELVFFAGEEQGLLGSRAYAQSLRLENVNVTLMIQADMLGYHVPGEEMQLGLPDRIATPEVTQLVVKLAEMYSPELSVGFTPACCSDHQSFYQLGFPSTQVFERAGPIADPMYHHSGDVSQRLGYDMVQVRAIGKVQFAALLHMTGIDFDDASEDWE